VIHITNLNELFDVGKDMALKKFYNQKKRGWIASKQIFQGNTKVWLLISQGNKGNKGNNTLLYNKIPEYWSMITKYHLNSDITTFTTFTTLNENGEIDDETNE